MAFPPTPHQQTHDEETPQQPESHLVPSPPEDGFVATTPAEDLWPADTEASTHAFTDGVNAVDEPLPWTEEDQARLDELNAARKRRSRRLVIELVQTLVLASLI